VVAALVTASAVSAAPAAADTPTNGTAGPVTTGAPSPGLPAPPRFAALACDTHAVGSFGYPDQTGAWRNSASIQVQVRDHLTGALIAALADTKGHFDICFTASQFTQLYITFKTENAAWRVANGTNVYNWSTPIRTNPVPGSTVDFGVGAPGDIGGSRAAHAYDEANDAWLLASNSNHCWDPKDTTCRQLRINWPSDPAAGSDHYDQLGNVVQLLLATPDAPMEVVHEIGHALMDDVYDDAFPSTAGCPLIHPPEQATTATCAWIEGWADYFALATYHTSVFVSTGGGTRDFEFPSWGTSGIANGDITQTRVVGALWDLTDPASSEVWDQHSEGFGVIFHVLARHVDNTFASYWNSRTADGVDVSDAGGLGSLYQNTIDYGYRRPLIDGKGQSLFATVPHNFGFETLVRTWSVVAVRPLGQRNLDLDLYGDRPQLQPPVGGSASAGQLVDFVAIDSNLRPVGRYFPRVTPIGADSNYHIEYVVSQQMLPPASTSTFHLDATQTVAIRDADLTAGVPVTITATPKSTFATASLFIMGDDPANPATFVRGRSSALASALAPTFAGPVSVTFTPPRTGRYGVVVTSDNDEGDFQLTRS